MNCQSVIKLGQQMKINRKMKYLTEIQAKLKYLTKMNLKMMYQKRRCGSKCGDQSSDRYTEEDRIRMQIICEIHDALHARDMATVFELCKNIKLDIPAGNSEADVDPDEFRDWPKYNVNNKYASYEGDYVCGVCHDDADHCHLKYIDVDLLMTDYKELINELIIVLRMKGMRRLLKHMKTCIIFSGKMRIKLKL